MLRARTLSILGAALACAAGAACKTEAARRQEIAACSERTSDPLEIELCLSSNYGWKDAEARTAAGARARELDSLEALRADSIWRLEGARRRAEILECGETDLKRCLVVRFAWPEDRAVAAAESTWRANAPRHRREIQACTGQPGVSVGNCLLLHYKWPPERALALDDSIQRARARR
ncbi:MAG TPA: hypothetical protein VNI61_11480 [Gemmatimonadales bacterium]|nr:hypothetical protein [Gemmatimonadales bacterium]